jgi:hypothetical protein
MERLGSWLIQQKGCALGTGLDELRIGPALILKQQARILIIGLRAY